MFKETMYLRFYGFFRIPLLFVVRPSVLEIDDKHSVVKIPLNYWTKNHLGSMYFGTLAIGADLGGGLIATHLIKKSGKKIMLVFKDFKADFLKRPESDVHFSCNDGEEIQKVINETIKTGKRVNTPMKITATCPKLFGKEPVAQFVLTLSLKAEQSVRGA